MGGPPYDCLSNPLGAVRSTFEKAVGSVSDPTSLDSKDWGVTDLFRNFLLDQSRLSHVPVLSPETVRQLQPNTLVRYRGMVQDMFGNEFYVGAYKDGSVWRTNKFTDTSQFPMASSPDMRLWERHLLYCVPVPGLNSWAESTSETLKQIRKDGASHQRDKRHRLDQDVSGAEPEGSPVEKKMRENGQPSSSLHCQFSETDVASSSMTMVSHVDPDSLPCLVKVYDCPESELKLNDIFEFIGVLSFDPVCAGEKDDINEFSSGHDEMLVDMSYSPSNQVPRLHCIIHRKLAISDFLCSHPITEMNPHSVKDAREALLRHLTNILGNDELTAHFMLLHLLSRIHARVDGVAVGKLSLNLTRLSKETFSVFGNQLSIAIKDLLPFTNCVPLTVDYLNTASLAPAKDYNTNRLIPGVLQLAEGSHLIIDETQLQAGTLNSTGVENARLLKELTEFQKVDYDFVYFKIEMAADIQLLVLSEGKSNILPADIVLPFQPSAVGSSPVVAAEALQAWRLYLASIRCMPHTIDSEMQKVIENDLVEARQADRSVGSQHFSRMLTMGRLISISFGENVLSMEHWQMVKELERLRRERLK